jgi:DNA ligase-1
MFKVQLCDNQVSPFEERYFKEMTFPKFGSGKLDGIRGVIKKGVALSRKGKPLPSLQIQEDYTSIEHVDGEFLEGDVTDPNVYNRTQSHVMSGDKPGDINYHVFDYTHPDWLDAPFYARTQKVQDVIAGLENYVYVEQTELNSIEEVLEFEQKEITRGMEGIILIDPLSQYKNGRSTFPQQIALKLKREEDDEGVIIGFYEAMDNQNEQQTNELGYAKRSKSKEGMVPANTLGGFIVNWKGVEQRVGCGVFTYLERKFIWDNRDKFLGEFLKFRHFPHGQKDKPRQPRALGFRDKMDM